MHPQPRPPGHWLADVLLGSPIPPPVWLDPRHAGSGWRAPGSRRYRYRVPAERIRAELAVVNSGVNRPVIQGWAWVLALLCGAAWLWAAWLLARGSGDIRAVVLFLAPLPVWMAAVWAGAFLSHDVELRDDEVVVRRWTDVWLGRRGRPVGGRASVRAILSRADRVQLAGEVGTVEVSMAMWPSSSRLALEPRLEAWGIELEVPGQHRPEHPAHWHRKHKAAGRTSPEHR